MHFLTLDKEITNARKKKILSGLSKEELFNILQFSKDDYSTFTNRRTEISDDFQRFLENLQGQKISSCSENYNTNSSDSWLDFKDQFFKYDESDKHFHNCNFLSLLPFGNCYHPIISFVNSLLKEGNSSAEQVFSKKAELSFLKYLSEKLSKVCSRVLMFEFKSRQSINDIFFNQFDLEHNSNVDYLNFEIFVIGDRWKTFFSNIPFLKGLFLSQLNIV